jgi:hypothetical protein
MYNSTDYSKTNLRIMWLIESFDQATDSQIAGYVQLYTRSVRQREYKNTVSQ